MWRREEKEKNLKRLEKEKKKNEVDLSDRNDVGDTIT